MPQLFIVIWILSVAFSYCYADCHCAKFIMLTVIVLSSLCWLSICLVSLCSVTFPYCYAECHYAECHYTECRYTECCYAEWRGAVKTLARKNLVAFDSTASILKKIFFKLTATSCSFLSWLREWYGEWHSKTKIFFVNLFFNVTRCTALKMLARKTTLLIV